MKKIILIIFIIFSTACITQEKEFDINEFSFGEDLFNYFPANASFFNYCHGDACRLYIFKPEINNLKIKDYLKTINFQSENLYLQGEIIIFNSPENLDSIFSKCKKTELDCVQFKTEGKYILSITEKFDSPYKWHHYVIFPIAEDIYANIHPDLLITSKEISEYDIKNIIKAYNEVSKTNLENKFKQINVDFNKFKQKMMPFIRDWFNIFNVTFSKDYKVEYDLREHIQNMKIADHTREQDRKILFSLRIDEIIFVKSNNYPDSKHRIPPMPFPLHKRESIDWTDIKIN